MSDYLPLSEYYLYCKTYRTYFDRWKYDLLEDAGHARCSYVTTLAGEEFLSVLAEEREGGCLGEEFVSSTIQRREQRLQELAQVLFRKRGYRVG